MKKWSLRKLRPMSELKLLHVALLKLMMNYKAPWAIGIPTEIVQIVSQQLINRMQLQIYKKDGHKICDNNRSIILLIVTYCLYVKDQSPSSTGWYDLISEALELVNQTCSYKLYYTLALYPVHHAIYLRRCLFPIYLRVSKGWVSV